MMVKSARTLAMSGNLCVQVLIHRHHCQSQTVGPRQMQSEVVEIRESLGSVFMEITAAVRNNAAADQASWE